jgi:hypothetical protein
MNTQVTRRTKITYFDDCKVMSVQHANGEWTSVLVDAPSDSPIGYGLSEFKSLADLCEKLPRWESEREESDQQADRIAYVRDHIRDYRKNEADFYDRQVEATLEAMREVVR